MVGSGYIYILMNSSMEGIVKIGKTTRDPQERTRELSNVTGVPTPFILVYKELFADCHVAEKLVHEVLEASGSRLADNREFFNVPIHEAITLVQTVKHQLDSEFVSVHSESIISKESLNDVNELLESLIEQGINYYYGTDDILEDLDEAEKLFKKAANLGSGEAYSYLGQIYHYEMDNYKEALKFYKKAIEKNYYDSYGSMASIYGNPTIKEYHINNAEKCWSKYFSFVEQQFFLTNQNFVRIGSYLEHCRINNISLRFKVILSKFEKEIINDFNEMISIYKEKGNMDFVKMYEEKKDSFIGQLTRK